MDGKHPQSTKLRQDGPKSVFNIDAYRNDIDTGNDNLMRAWNDAWEIN